jgi:hypothetical protein
VALFFLFVLKHFYSRFFIFNFNLILIFAFGFGLILLPFISPSTIQLIDDSTSSSARTRFTTGREMPSSLSSKFATPSASERGGKLNSNRPSARGGSGEAAGGGGVAESQSVVDKRWRDRKREGKLKLRWVRFMAEELVRQVGVLLIP